MIHYEWICVGTVRCRMSFPFIPSVWDSAMCCFMLPPVKWPIHLGEKPVGCSSVGSVSWFSVLLMPCNLPQLYNNAQSGRLMPSWTDWCLPPDSSPQLALGGVIPCLSHTNFRIILFILVKQSCSGFYRSSIKSAYPGVKNFYIPYIDTFKSWMYLP